MTIDEFLELEKPTWVKLKFANEYLYMGEFERSGKSVYGTTHIGIWPSKKIFKVAVMNNKTVMSEGELKDMVNIDSVPQDVQRFAIREIFNELEG